MSVLDQFILRQTETHQLLLHDCDLRLQNDTLTIFCNKQSDAEALKEAILLLAEDLKSIAEDIVIYLGQCKVYRCTVNAALRKYSLKLTALYEQLRKAGIVSK